MENLLTKDDIAVLLNLLDQAVVKGPQNMKAVLALIEKLETMLNSGEDSG